MSPKALECPFLDLTVLEAADFQTVEHVMTALSDDENGGGGGGVGRLRV